MIDTRKNANRKSMCAQKFVFFSSIVKDNVFPYKSPLFMFLGHQDYDKAITTTLTFKTKM